MCCTVGLLAKYSVKPGPTTEAPASSAWLIIPVQALACFPDHSDSKSRQLCMQHSPCWPMCSAKQQCS